MLALAPHDAIRNEAIVHVGLVDENEGEEIDVGKLKTDHYHYGDTSADASSCAVIDLLDV